MPSLLLTPVSMTDAFSDASNAEPPFCVTEPFTGDDYADVILRSADNHDFHVMKGVLAMASPVFKDMFSLPHPPAAVGCDAVHDLPIVDISETGPVTNVVLRYLYPVQNPKITDVHMAFSVLRAADKYHTEFVMQKARKAIRQISASGSEGALKVYALACSNHFEDEARLAALYSLGISIIAPPLVPELSQTTGGAVMQLFVYHEKVRNRLSSLFSNALKDNLPRVAVELVTCSDCQNYEYEQSNADDPHDYIFVSPWWQKIRKDMTSRLRCTNGPMREDMLSQEMIVDAVKSTGCNDCKKKSSKTCPLLFGILKLEMRRLSSEVELELPWKPD